MADLQPQPFVQREPMSVTAMPWRPDDPAARDALIGWLTSIDVSFDLDLKTRSGEPATLKIKGHPVVAQPGWWIVRRDSDGFTYPLAADQFASFYAALCPCASDPTAACDFSPADHPSETRSALCEDVERDRDQLAAVCAEIGDLLSPTGERPEEALGTLAGDVARLAEQRDAVAALAGEILREFTQHGHPGRPATRTGWVWTETVNGWRSRLAELSPPPDPPAG
ncbi:hypothetical protein [Micromonospora sp. RTP1Z1]|uniref:hypothetical protein n=1 Tax=Micromonospora sp. RTP1Z1 TaxID=2994043 RepID=UPI0029C84F26|nr:hypothetical protein [Micromonospora sp. RTP1Z1]